MKATTKKKIIIGILGVLGLYAIFGAVVISLFYMVRYNPIDGLSIAYMRSNEDFKSQYGEIVTIGRNPFCRTEKSEAMIKAPYTIDSVNGKVVVYVTLINDGDGWEAVSYEVIKVLYTRVE